MIKIKIIIVMKVKMLIQKIIVHGGLIQENLDQKKVKIYHIAMKDIIIMMIMKKVIGEMKK